MITEKAYEAYYKLTDPVLQIKSYVEVREAPVAWFTRIQSTNRTTNRSTH